MLHRQEPQPEGCPGTLKNRAGCRRSLALTSCAPKLTSVSRPCLLAPTCGTAEPIAPSQTPQVLDTCHLGREPLLEINQRARVVDAGDRIPSFLSHEASIALRERSGYPAYAYYVSSSGVEHDQNEINHFILVLSAAGHSQDAYTLKETCSAVHCFSRSASGSWRMPGTCEVVTSPGPLRTISGLPISFL